MKITGSELKMKVSNPRALIKISTQKYSRYIQLKYGVIGNCYTTLALFKHTHHYLFLTVDDMCNEYPLQFVRSFVRQNKVNILYNKKFVTVQRKTYTYNSAHKILSHLQITRGTQLVPLCKRQPWPVALCCQVLHLFVHPFVRLSHSSNFKRISLNFIVFDSRMT